MNQGGYVTLVGYVAREPTVRQLTDGTLVADMRIGTASRVFDRKTETWKDGDQSYFTVTFWRRLATAAKACFRKGDPVIVRGRFRTRTFEGKDGQPRNEIEVTAEAFGHDCTRGVATFLYYGRPKEIGPAQKANGEVTDDDDPGDEGTMGAPGGQPYDSPPAGPAGRTDTVADRLIDEGAVARFNEDMADDGAVARELADAEPSARDRSDADADADAEEPTRAALPF